MRCFVEGTLSLWGLNFQPWHGPGVSAILPAMRTACMHQALLSIEIMHRYVRSEMEECIHVELRMANINPQLFTLISLQRRRGS